MSSRPLRVCENSGEVLLSEEKTLPSVIREGQQPHIGFAPQPHLLTLYSVFCAVTGLSSGAYLLHHDAKTEAFIKLMRAGDADRLGHLQAFNLHSSYALATPTTRPYTVPPWLAIDTHLLTPFHYKHCKIPATFPMDNPDKKLTTSQKKKKSEKAKNKKKLADLEKMAEDESQKEKD